MYNVKKMTNKTKKQKSLIYVNNKRARTGLPGWYPLRREQVRSKNKKLKEVIYSFKLRDERKNESPLYSVIV